jgi:hypothetical protein
VQQLFNHAELDADAVVYVIFLRSKPTATVGEALRGLETDNDEVRFGKREVYWLRRE